MVGLKKDTVLTSEVIGNKWNSVAEPRAGKSGDVGYNNPLPNNNAF